MDFGTDGIRSTDMDYLCRVGYRLGLAQRGKSKAVVGVDNRPTSTDIAKAVAAGLGEAGVDVLFGGVMPTPALQYATRYYTADVGFMITASHNPARYNGIKVFNADGLKPDRTELRALADRVDDAAPCAYTGGAALSPVDNVAKAYTERFRHFGRLPLRVAVDCANGAAYPIVKRILSLHEVEGMYLHHGEGKQINRDCGALHPEHLKETTGVDLAVALDGDGDRCVLVTKGGQVVWGDGILYLLAAYYTRKGVDVGGAIASTVMANGALRQALAALELRLVRTDVGDAEVAEAMRRHNLRLGGEPSGHILADGYVADGIYTAMLLTQIAAECNLDDLLEPYHPLPQCHTMVNAAPDALRRALAAADKWQDYLSGTGRVVVRPSGTEPVVRIMVECVSAGLAQTIADSIAQAARH